MKLYRKITGRIWGDDFQDAFQQAGDSGGVVFISKTDVDGGAIAIGILSGGVDHENAMYFTSINDLPRSLQTRY